MQQQQQMQTATPQMINLDELHFDPQNPRLPVELYYANDETVLRHLLLKGDLVDVIRIPFCRFPGFFCGRAFSE